MISPYKKGNLVLNLSFQLALDVIEYTELLETKRKFNMANQLFRSGTSIHANIREAQNAESKADFIHKMKIAAKEGDEQKFWMFLMKFSKHYPDPQEMIPELEEIEKILTSIIATSKRNG